MAFPHARQFKLWLAGLLLAATLSPTLAPAADTLAVYIGTYTGKSQGIYQIELDLATGKLTHKSVATGVKNPSFLAIHPSGKFLYSIAELTDSAGKRQGGLAAFSLDPKSGALMLLNQESSVGDGPCHLVVDHSGKCVLAANYGGGSVCCLPIAADGKLAAATTFVQHPTLEGPDGKKLIPRGHSINVDKNNRFAVAADLGINQMRVYKLDAAAGKLTANDPPSTSLAPGSGPRHFAFHPTNKFAYVINESAMTMTAFAYDAEAGKLTEQQTLSTLPPGVSKQPGMSTAEVQVHPTGKFVYGSNRGHDTIVAYSVDPATGKLTYIENESTGGKTPRNFGLDPSGKFLLAANQASDTIKVFRINAETGALDATEHSIDVPSPVCVKFLKLAE